jgi:hypothetical protein
LGLVISAAFALRMKKERLKFANANTDEITMKNFNLESKVRMPCRCEGSKINSSMLSAIDRLRTWDSRTQVYTSTDKNLTQAFTQLDTLNKVFQPTAITSPAASHPNRFLYR